MKLYLTAVALILTAAILILILDGQHKAMSVLLSLSACSVVSICAVEYLQPVFDLMRRLRELADISSDLLEVLIKTAGIALLGELSALICADIGRNALGKSAQLLSCGAILWISIPLLEQLIGLLQEVLGAY